MKFREYNNLYSTTNVRRGIIRSANLSDELDSTTIILTQVDKLNIQPYDLVELTNEYDELEYWLVANFHRKNVSFKPPVYDYTIDLMSITKLLETVILPNMTVTNIGQNRSVLTYIENAMRGYFSNSYGRYTISNEVIELCGNVVCPECDFFEPTLREYLDHLLGFVNCLVKLKFEDGEFVLTYLDLNPNGSKMNTDCLLSLEQSQNAEQYATQLEHTLNNNIGQFPIKEYHKLKSDTFLFDSNSAKLILHHKPYDIKKLIVKNVKFSIRAYMQISGNSNTIDGATIYFNSGDESEYSKGGLYRYINNVDVDLTNYLAIDQVFQSLATLEQGMYEELDEAYCGTKFKNNTLRWSRGSNIIDNLHYYETKSIMWSESDEAALAYAIMSAIYMKLDMLLSSASFINEDGKQVTYSRKAFDSTSGITYNYDWKNDWSDIIFEVEYIPYINAKTKLKKKSNARHLVSAVDNSTNASSDISSLIRSSHEKIKQLGNDSLMFYARSDISKYGKKPIYNLGDFYIEESGDKYILNHLEYEFKTNCILYKGIITKNYSNRNMYTLINREKRYYSLADASESVIRNEFLTREYSIMLSEEYDNSILMLVKPFNVAGFISQFEEEEIEERASGYIPSITIAEKNIIQHSVIFQDNVVYATRVGYTESNTGGYDMELLQYTNSLGELEYVEVTYFSTTGKDLDTLLECEKTTIGLTTMFNASTPVATFDILKDSREQLCLNVQNVLVNTPNSVVIDENNITKLLKAKWIAIETDSVGILLDTEEKKLNFGKPLHEITSVPINYPCTVRVLAENTPCIEIKGYNGEYLSLAKVIRTEITPIFHNAMYSYSFYDSQDEYLGGHLGHFRYEESTVFNIGNILKSHDYSGIDASKISRAHFEIWHIGPWGPLDVMTLNFTITGVRVAKFWLGGPCVNEEIEGVNVWTKYCNLNGSVIQIDDVTRVECTTLEVDFKYAMSDSSKIVYNGPRWEFASK